MRVYLAILALLLAFLFAVAVMLFCSACVGGHGVGDEVSPVTRFWGKVAEGNWTEEKR